jgi:hypothetical protein
MTRRRVNRDLDTLAERLHRASLIVPVIEDDLVQRLAHCDTNAQPEARVAGGEMSDPVMRVILARADILTKQNAITAAIVEIREAVDRLDEATRKARAHDNTEPDQPVCYEAGCSDPVSSYRLANGDYAYRMGGEYAGLCDRHRKRAQREAVMA